MFQQKLFPPSVASRKTLDANVFVEMLLGWYRQYKRALPWRETRDAYKVWLSEVILQQTRVVQALPYYERFIRSFPSVEALAGASEKDVLHLWEGLGYYGRARRLHACSQYIVEHLQGVFPSSYTELIKLPGVGPYTAAAVASIAFQECVPVVDGNVYRVLGRLFGVKDNMSSSQGKKVFHQLAQHLMPSHLPDVYNQAIMEFGALHCTPRQPSCSRCPFQSFCYAYHHQAQQLLPVKREAPKVGVRFLYYIILHFKGRIYFKKRTKKDIWRGLYDFYLIEEKRGLLSFDQLGQDRLVALVKRCKVKVQKSGYTTVHQLTHQRLYPCFFHVYADEAFMEKAGAYLEEVGMDGYAGVDEVPVPMLIKRFCQEDKGVARYMPKV